MRTKTNIFPTNLRPEYAGDAPQKEKILRPECDAEAPTFLSAVYKRCTQAKKRQAYAPQYGRSMIEMLGVLAIIGVLTVGSIAGYNKAMRRHLLNKQREQISYILSAVETHHDIFNASTYHGSGYLRQAIETFGWIPEEMIKDDSNYIYDVFNNRIFLGYEANPQFYLFLNIQDTEAYEQCVNIHQIIRSFHSFLKQSFVHFGNETGTTGSAPFYGDQYCNNFRCMRDMTITQIAEACHQCDKASDFCRIHLRWE